MTSPMLDSLLAAASPTPSPARAAAIEALRRDGLPGARDEAWRYTSLRALEQRRYAAGDAAAASRAVDAAAFALPGIEGCRLVFVNGAFRADLSACHAVDGLDVRVLGEQPQALDALLQADPAGSRSDAFGRLNTALVRDGAYLRVAAGERIDAPLHVVFVGAPADTELAWQARLHVELGEDASLALIEHHVGAGAHAHLGNLVVAGMLAARARLDLLQVQDAAEGAPLVRRSAFTLADDAELVLHTLEVGAHTMRHDLRVDLAGRGARVRSRGVFALHGRQHADTRLDVRHRARETACDIAWRGVADQRSRGVFHGAITIEAGADGADAQLSNKNLLLSAQAEIDTQPVLEIHADEVKAAHGATVGQLDERALFYLRSRGIPAAAARRMLVGAFCSAVLTDVAPVRLRERLEALLAARLPLGEEA